ncbi:MAG: hypothetical protein M3Y83_09280 [Actinomycetota bacterium]|nr:hypothetical protein [Actinomycetota bacterium]
MTTDRGSKPDGGKYDPAQDPDADPEMLQAQHHQPDQAEGADDPSETGSS